MTFRLTPDGVRYLAMGAGYAQPMPFHLRTLLPLVCGTNRGFWIAANFLGIAGSAILIVALAVLQGAATAQGVLAAALFLSLPWVRFCSRAPVLVDMPALALALFSAVLFLSGYVALSVFAAGIAGLSSEKAPVWAALFAWHPVLLIGLIAPALMRLTSKPREVDPAEPHAETLTNPVRSAMRYHHGQWLDPRIMLLPWGACLLAVANPSAQLAAVVAVAYAQLLVATDSVRLYQQAAPIVCISAATALPFTLPIVAVIAAAHLSHPWRRARA
jgi:hypothetical protein